MSPEEELFRKHADEAGFQSGVERQWWGVQGTPSWPTVIIWVAAATKPNSPDQHYFQFNLTGYSNSAPICYPCDENGVAISNEKWPRGGPVTTSVFNPNWNREALYIACDREAMRVHPDWQSHPEKGALWWKAGDRIEKYINALHARLNSKDYAGA